MLNDVAGITRVRMLYLQLLYQCNFACRHCFHGELLKDREQFTLAEVQAILEHFRDNYRLDAVTLLGGEPLLYPEIISACRYAKGLGLQVEICTNGHRGFRDKITTVGPYLDRLRVSLDGLSSTHDNIRQAGSFAGALETIDHAVGLGLAVGATMTVTDRSLDEVVPLARLLEQRGVIELKLHALRPVGNAAVNPDLAVFDTSRYGDLHRQISAAQLDIAIIYDSVILWSLVVGCWAA